MFEKMWVVVSGNAPSPLFCSKGCFFFVTRVRIEHVFLFLGSECASGLSCIFVVKVECALQFHVAESCSPFYTLFVAKTEYSDAKVIRGRARNQGADKDF